MTTVGYWNAKQIHNRQTGVKNKLVGNCYSGRMKEQVIYAVCLKEHPDVTKIGMTGNWKNRQREYAFWNFSDGDGIEKSIRFIITGDFIDLREIEQHILDNVPFSLWKRQEWFEGHIDDVVREIDRILTATELDYVID